MNSCKKVLLIDATDYPLVRVIKPLPSPDPTMLKWSIWAFYEYDHGALSRKQNILMKGGKKNDNRKDFEEVEEGKSVTKGDS